MRSEIGISIFSFFLLMSLVAGCGFRSRDTACRVSTTEYNDFGIKCAGMGLWNEAIMRWERVIEIDPNNAQAHNNLGVAYESKGKLEAALAEYKTAIELDPDNETYISNYAKFERNYERARKRDETQNTRPKTQDTRPKT